MAKLEKGQQVYLLSLNKRFGAEQKILEAAVEHVGRKYVTVRQGPYCTKFDLETRLEVDSYTVGSKLFFSKSDAEDEIRRGVLEHDMRRSFSQASRHLSLDQLQRIQAILSEG